MKKLLLAIAIVVILFIISVYAFIPGKIIITESRVVGTTAGGFDTCLHNLKKWQQWWPAKLPSLPDDSLFPYNDYAYKLSDIFADGGTVKVGLNSLTILSRIQVITKDRDSVTAEWTISLPTGKNPFTRFERYLNAPAFKKNMGTVFDSLCHFAGETENVYGFRIERTTFSEIYLLAYRFKTASYPATEIIYNAINKLNQYVAGAGVTDKYYPMTNTKQVDSSQYETMVAISIDKPIAAKGDFFLSQMMPMKDRFLTTEVTGGKDRLAKAHKAIEKYMSDHSLSAPARPFEVLVTDRIKETDSTKWRTKIFYPSM